MPLAAHLTRLTPLYAIGYAWFGWGVSWLVAALWSARPANRAGLSAEAPNRIVTMIGAILLYVAFRRFDRQWLLSVPTEWLCFAAVLAGIAFAWWARLHLGALWSGNVTRKPDHRIVDTGPYALVRHPIYTGILFSAFATSIAAGTIWAVVGAVLMAVGFAMKARLEETFLVSELGEAGYAAYRARVPMLVPFWPP